MLRALATVRRTVWQLPALPRRRPRRLMPQQSINTFFRPSTTKVQPEQAKGRPGTDEQPSTTDATGQKRPTSDTPMTEQPQQAPALRAAAPGPTTLPATTPAHDAPPPSTSHPPAPAPAASAPHPAMTQPELEALAQERLQACRQLCATAASTSTALPLTSLLLDPGWSQALAQVMTQPSFSSLSQFVDSEYRKATVYPPRERIFHALNVCPLEQVRVVIVGQDPYHGPNQAMGLCFSVNKGVRVPQSLNTIYKELNQDLGHPIPKHGDLSSWSTQGVLMLNTMLTVRGAAPASHKGKGWEGFTDAAIAAVSRNSQGVVFLLWGKHAHDKVKLVDGNRHHVLMAAHPSPLAAASGKYFVGCKHFSQANALLVKQGRPPINWCIS